MVNERMLACKEEKKELILGMFVQTFQGSELKVVDCLFSFPVFCRNLN